MQISLLIQNRPLYHWRKHFYELWTRILAKRFEVKKVLMMDLFQLLSSQDGLMDWSGVDYLWIIVIFLSAVWTLILTAPIHCRASIDETVMQCWISSEKSVLIKKHILLGWPEGEYIFSKLIFWWTIPLNCCIYGSVMYELLLSC